MNTFNNKGNDSLFSIIDISNILVVNYKNDVDNYILNTKKEEMKKQFIIDNLVEQLFLNKKEYYYKFILAEICFNTNNIKLINCKDIINYSDSQLFNKYLKTNNEFISKYMAYIEILNPFTRQKYVQLYMASINNNIENYFSANYISSLSNINKSVLQNIFSENFSIFNSTDNYLFIDFLIGFLYDIDKRTEYIKNNNKSNNDNNIIPLEDTSINEYLLSIFEIIINLKNRNIINYFLYENDNICIKLKYFFKRNIYLLNDELLLIKLIDLLNNKIEFLLMFNNEIFLDLLIFSLINNKNQNIILINIKKILEGSINDNNKLDLNDNIYSLLYKLLEKFFNLVLYYQLYTTEIEDTNNEKQINIIIYCVSLIFEKIIYISNKKYDIKITQLTVNIINICSKLQESVQTHDIKSFLDKYKKILSEDFIFIDNCQINHQIELITNSLSKFLLKLMEVKKNDESHLFEFFLDNKNENENENIINNITNYDDLSSIDNKDTTINSTTNSSQIFDLDSDDNNEQQNNNLRYSKKCYFCSYLYTYFKIKFDSIYEEIKYDKYKKNFYRNIFLNFDEYKPKLGINNYIWYLSQKESSHKIQNKFFLKENRIKIKGKKFQTNENLFIYEYINDMEQYNKYIVELHKLFIYDNISIDHHFIYSYNILNYENNIIKAENCLLINKIHNTVSLLLIYNDFLLIMTHICIDNDQKLHVAVNDFNMNIWCIKYEDYLVELDNYIKNNENDIINNYFVNKEINNNNKISQDEFGYNKNYKFNIKKLDFSEINEMHKVSYLQIPNSIEIVAKNGKNYFLCFNVEKRDSIFSTIINNISNITYNNIRKYKYSILKKLSKTHYDNCFYMKHCPLYYLENYKDNIILSYLGTSSKFQ